MPSPARGRRSLGHVATALRAVVAALILLDDVPNGFGAPRCLAGALKLPITPAPLQTKGVFVLLMDDVGLAPGARIWVNITNSVAGSSPVVVLLNSGEWSRWTLRYLPTYPPNGTAKPVSGYLISQWRGPLNGTVMTAYNVTGPRIERYSVGILNMMQEQLMLEGEILFENPGGEQLPMELVELPRTMLTACIASVILAIVVSCAAVAVPRNCRCLPTRWTAMRPSLPLSFLAAYLWLKSVTLSLRYKYWHSQSLSGDAPLWILHLYRLSSKLHATVSVLFLLLTALGWRVLRPRLQPPELRGIAMITSFGVSLALLEASHVFGDDYLAHQFIALLFYIFRVMCYLAVIVATNFNLKLIELHIDDSPFSAQAAFLYSKQQTYIAFRRIFVVVVFRPSILLWIRLSVLGPESTDEWADQALDAFTSWLVDVAFFLTLRPGQQKSGINELQMQVRHHDIGGFLGLDDSTSSSGSGELPLTAQAVVDAALAGNEEEEDLGSLMLPEAAEALDEVLSGTSAFDDVAPSEPTTAYVPLVD